MSKSIVFYFSATNTTKQRAEKVAQKLGADLFEIHAAKPYSVADLDWHDPQSRTSIEQHQHASRVAIKDDLPDISSYDTVLIGFPIWWGIPPRLIADLIDHL
ncbi:flavodoxin, partial [Limosilactobacillus mucosae]|nr:flavodoxin [Limosilactobacillus mucosae]